MATSESDDFESADEEMSGRTERRTENRETLKRYKSIGSDSDDDVEYIPVQSRTPLRSNKREYKNPKQKQSFYDNSNEQTGKNETDEKEKSGSESNEKDLNSANKEEQKESKNLECESNSEKTNQTKENMLTEEKAQSSLKGSSSRRERPERQRKPREAMSLGAKKLGATKIDQLPSPGKASQDEKATTPDEINRKAKSEGKQAPLIQECWEECDEQNLQDELRKANERSALKKKIEPKTEDLENVPEELKSNLKFKDIFKPEGWEGITEDIELPDDLSDDKYQPILDKLTKSGEQENSNGSWGGWGSWGVSTLLNTASASVSTLTSHVSQGLSMLEESMGIPDAIDSAKPETPDEKPKTPVEEIEETKESPIEYFPSFGFGNLMSSVSSITKLVESTSTKVIAGGLDTLESIGKKTMEVLQEGDPGLKKKRAFFLNDADKPILSQVLREAKEKADTEEKTIEEKELARKVHFESLFDDYQGLVHLEALEMLSKQSNMKIQQQLVNLDGSELTSMQETLDEVKELCDLGDEDDEEDEEDNEKNLQQKLQEACKDLGVSITYDKLIDIWNEMNSQLPPPESKEISHREIFQKAISALAQFTAYSIERFHKTAELLLIKPRRSTVNEADSLVQLAKTLSSQIGVIVNLYCDNLKKFQEEKSEVHTSIKTIALEGANAISYVQEAFRLLIPILQVGAI